MVSDRLEVLKNPSQSNNRLRLPSMRIQNDVSMISNHEMDKVNNYV